MVFLSRFYFILILAVLLALGSSWCPGGVAPSVFLTLLLIGAVLTDLLFIPQPALQATRQVAPVVRQSQLFSVELTLFSLMDSPALFFLLDSPPATFPISRVPVPLRLQPRQETRHAYAGRSHQRGTFSFGPIYYRVQGPLGFVQRQGKIEQTQKIEVLPNFGGDAERDLQLALAGTMQQGNHSLLRRGEGREFESLRDYQRDDDFRQIDWKASARRGKLICRQYETERDQRLMILLDTGRHMTAKIGPYRKLDYAINAALHLAQIALQKGDLVGTTVFRDEIQAMIEPRKGQAHLAQLVRGLAAWQPSRLESDYAATFHQVLKRCSRRTLVVCFTDLNDTASVEALLQAAKSLLPRHLPVIISVSNSDILAVTRQEPQEEIDIFRHVAALEIWTDYERTLRRLFSHGIAAVSVPAQELSLATIQKYLRIKESGRL